MVRLLQDIRQDNRSEKICLETSAIASFVLACLPSDGDVGPFGQHF